MNDTGATCDQHARPGMAAQGALSVSGPVVVLVVTVMAVPPGGVRIEVVVGRLDDGQPGDRHKLREERGSGRSPDPECVGRPQHSAKLVPVTDTLQDGPAMRRRRPRSRQPPEPEHPRYGARLSAKTRYARSPFSSPEGLTMYDTETGGANESVSLSSVPAVMPRLTSANPVVP